MLGGALKTAVHYVKAPLLERSHFLTRWLGAIRTQMAVPEVDEGADVSSGH